MIKYALISQPRRASQDVNITNLEIDPGSQQQTSISIADFTAEVNEAFLSAISVVVEVPRLQVTMVSVVRARRHRHISVTHIDTNTSACAIEFPNTVLSLILFSGGRHRAWVGITRSNYSFHCSGPSKLVEHLDRDVTFNIYHNSVRVSSESECY